MSYKKKIKNGILYFRERREKEVGKMLMEKKQKTVDLMTNVDKYNTNAAFFRFLAALLVIVAHAFPLSCGNGYTDILGRISGGEINFGAISVGFFFWIGGFYIARSMLRLKSGVAYFILRIKRIFPGLLFMVVVSLLLGSVFTTYSFQEYWCSSESWSYLWNVFFILHHDLPGVFQDNPYTSTVNGSLWTLPVEFFCYIGCYLLYRMKLLSKQFWISSILLMGISVITAPYIFASPVIRVAYRAGLLFYIGMGCYVYREKIVLSKKWNGISWCSFFLLLVLKQGNLAMITAFPYLILYGLFATKPCAKNLAKLGNLSYGIYLSAFPIQQSIVLFSKNPYVNIILSIPIAMGFGG